MGVTNLSGTVIYKKSGKILPQDPVVVEVTNVLEKGINIWLDETDDGEELMQKDDIYGFELLHKYNNITSSRLMMTTTGFQYASKLGTGNSNTYVGFTCSGNMSNQFFQNGTNINDSTKIDAPRMELPTNKVSIGTTMIKQNNNDRFVSLSDLIIILKAYKENKLTLTTDSIIISE